MVNCVANDFKGEGSVIYYSGEGSSPALDWYAEQTGKNWPPTGDYRRVLDFRYYGTSEPPERDLSVQITDWLNGYMWGRYQVNENCEKDPNGGYYYLVQYKATLNEAGVPPEEEEWKKYALIVGGALILGLLMFGGRKK